MEGHVTHSHIKQEVTYPRLKNIGFTNLNLEWKCNVSYHGSALLHLNTIIMNLPMTCGSDDVKEPKNHCKDVNISKIIIKKMSVISAMTKSSMV